MSFGDFYVLQVVSGVPFVKMGDTKEFTHSLTDFYDVTHQRTQVRGES